MSSWYKRINWFLFFSISFFIVFFVFFGTTFVYETSAKLRSIHPRLNSFGDWIRWIQFHQAYDLGEEQKKVESCIREYRGHAFDTLWDSKFTWYYDCGFEVATELYKTDPERAIALCIRNVKFELDLDLQKEICRDVIEEDLKNAEKQRALYEPLEKAHERYQTIRTEDDVFGLPSEKARLKIVRYINYYYSYSFGLFDKLLLNILPDYQDKISVIFKHAPVGRLDGPTWWSFTPESPEFRAAEAARCASEQGKFLEFHRAFLAKTDEFINMYPRGKFTEPFRLFFENTAENAGLTMKDFLECFESRRYGLYIEDQIQAYLKERRSLGDDREVYFDGEKQSSFSHVKSEEELRNKIDTLFDPPKPKTEEEQREEIQTQFLNQMCPESVFDLEEFIISQDAFKTRCLYEKSTQKLLPKSDYAQGPYCESDFQAELREHEYNMVSGCLYKGHKRLFEKTIFSMILSGEFGESYQIPHHLFIEQEEKLKSIGEEAREWFRFRHDGKLYVFFFGVAGCGGCFYNGPYLIIDETTSTFEKKSANLPYGLNLILSPGRRYAVEFVDLGKELYLYDFVKLSRIKVLYTFPEGMTVIGVGHGSWIPPEALQWIDDGHIQLHLIKADEEGYAAYAKDEEGNTIWDQYLFEGEPFIVETGIE